jgi:hypothetical protein
MTNQLERRNRFGYPRTGEERNALATITRFVSRWVRQSALTVTIFLREFGGSAHRSSNAFADVYLNDYEATHGVELPGYQIREYRRERGENYNPTTSQYRRQAGYTSEFPWPYRRAQYSASQLYQMPRMS